MHPNFSLVSPPYRGNTVSYDGESASGLWWFWLRFWFVALFCFGLGVFWCFIPHHHVVFPFLSTMTWAHRPHGVRTRGKKRLAGTLTAFGMSQCGQPSKALLSCSTKSPVHLSAHQMLCALKCTTIFLHGSRRCVQKIHKSPWSSKGEPSSDTGTKKPKKHGQRGAEHPSMGTSSLLCARTPLVER